MTAGAFRRALEERLKRASLTDQIDPNRLRRQVSFDRLLARLFREESAPWVLKRGYALELHFVREMLQSAADISLGDWFEFAAGVDGFDRGAAAVEAFWAADIREIYWRSSSI